MYNWQHNQYAEQQCRDYLKQFITFELKQPEIFRKKYHKLLLCQAHNEAGFNGGFLQNMTQYFDGIILLDNKSTDTHGS